MAHHSKETPESMREIMERLNLGPTGKYPHGKLNECDDGEIRLAIMADVKNNIIVLHFGKPTTWIGFYPQQAERIIESLQKQLFKLRGIDEM